MKIHKHQLDDSKINQDTAELETKVKSTKIGKIITASTVVVPFFELSFLRIFIMLPHIFRSSLSELRPGKQSSVLRHQTSVLRIQEYRDIGIYINAHPYIRTFLLTFQPGITSRGDQSGEDRRSIGNRQGRLVIGCFHGRCIFSSAFGTEKEHK